MEIINIINLKGGVGKTFTAANVAYILSHTHRKTVLMLDNDKQGNLSKLYGAYNGNNICPAAKLLSKEYNSLNELVQPVYEAEKASLDIIPSNMSLLSATWNLSRSEDADQVSRYQVLRNITTADGRPYDYIIIDNPPDLALNVINALMAADQVIIPLKIDQWSLEGLEIISEQIEEIRQGNPSLQLGGILPTMYQNDDVNNAGLEWLKDSAYPVFSTPIRYSRKSPESTFYNVPIIQHSVRSATAQSYKKFVVEFLERTGGV